MNIKKFILFAFPAILILALANIWISGKTDAPKEILEVPPLTYTHKFKDCPFTIDLPHMTEAEIEESYDEEENRITYDHDIGISALCFNKYERNFLPHESLELAEFMINDIQKNLKLLNQHDYDEYFGEFKLIPIEKSNFSNIQNALYYSKTENKKLMHYSVLVFNFERYFFIVTIDFSNRYSVGNLEERIYRSVSNST